MAFTLADMLSLFSPVQICSIVDSREKPISLWHGSVGSGKTHASLYEFVRAIRHAPTRGRIVMIGRTIDTIAANLFSLLQDADVFGRDVADHVKYTQGAKTARIYGRLVELVGADNLSAIGRIQGRTIALAYVDEAVLLPEPFWDMLVTRIRVGGARLLATMNPASRNHYMFKKWINDPSKAADVAHFPLTMDDNPYYDTAEGRPIKERLLRLYPKGGVFHARFILGQWTNATGAIYSMFDESRHVVKFDQLPRMQKVIGVGYDHGVSNPTRGLMLGLTREVNPRLAFMDEFDYSPSEELGRPRLSPTKLTREHLIPWLGQIHDPYEQNLAPDYHVVDPAAAGFVKAMQEEGIPGLRLANNDVMPGIATLQRLFDYDQIIVSDRCVRFLEEITEYSWSEKATAEGEDEPDKDANKDHSMDAARYITHTTRGAWRYELKGAA